MLGSGAGGWALAVWLAHGVLRGCSLPESTQEGWCNMGDLQPPLCAASSIWPPLRGFPSSSELPISRQRLLSRSALNSQLHHKLPLCQHPKDRRVPGVPAGAWEHFLVQGSREAVRPPQITRPAPQITSPSEKLSPSLCLSLGQYPAAWPHGQQAACRSKELPSHTSSSSRASPNKCTGTAKLPLGSGNPTPALDHTGYFL